MLIFRTDIVFTALNQEAQKTEWWYGVWTPVWASLDLTQGTWPVPACLLIWTMAVVLILQTTCRHIAGTRHRLKKTLGTSETFFHYFYLWHLKSSQLNIIYSHLHLTALCHFSRPMPCISLSCFYNSSLKQFWRFFLLYSDIHSMHKIQKVQTRKKQTNRRETKNHPQVHYLELCC